MAICPNKITVIQICNSNSEKDDNFNVFLNGVFIGSLDLSQDDLVGSLFIGSPSAVVSSADFVCPLDKMITYRFDESLINIGSNSLVLQNIRANDNGNFGSIGIRSYELIGNFLTNPITIADLSYSGGTGSNFELSFDFTCPDSTTTASPTTTSTTTPNPGGGGSSGSTNPLTAIDDISTTTTSTTSTTSTSTTTSTTASPEVITTRVCQSSKCSKLNY